MLGRVGRSVRGISRRLIASYVLVTVFAVLLLEAFVLLYQAPRLVSDAQIAAELRATAKAYGTQLVDRHPRGLPRGSLLGQRGQSPGPGTATTTPDGSALIVPAIPGKINSHRAVTAVVALTAGGTIVASSAPSRYPPGQSAAKELPAAAEAAIRADLAKGVAGRTGSTPYGRVSWTLEGWAGPAALSAARQDFMYLYVQAPQPTGFISPIRAWDELDQISGNSPLFAPLYALVIVILPFGVLFGLLSSRRLVRRVRRLERATVAVADGDYSVTLDSSGHDEVGKLEANFASMAQQLSSALEAERERASNEARDAERSRIARDIHDAISQHLFGLRMIASGMRRADPQNEQVQAIERITDEALRDMQALLWELRPAGLDGVNLAPALQKMCAAYRDRLGVTVEADLADVALPPRVEEALLRVTQEACTNAIRHGNAGRLTVSVTCRGPLVELAVRDNGRGFDPGTRHGGSGLRHMRDRVNELGGTVSIESTPGSGAAITVLVPTP